MLEFVLLYTCMYMQGEESGNEANPAQSCNFTYNYNIYTEHIQESSIIHLTVHILHSNLKK